MISLLETTIAAIIALGVLIFVHELGHFLVAKLMGVGVHTFSLGFGKKLLGRRFGETQYQLSAFPLGGYVKLVGESDTEFVSDQNLPRSFAAKSPLRRIAIVAAGPVFNLLFAYLLLVAIFLIGLPVLAPQIGSVLKDKPAAQAGLLAGDVIVAVNGTAVDRWNAFAEMVAASKGKPLSLEVARGSQHLSFRVIPAYMESKNLFGETITTPAIGVTYSGKTFKERLGPLAAVRKGTEKTIYMTSLMWQSLVKLAQGSIPFSNVGGPIMIVKLAGDKAAEGIVNYLAFLALFSINLGVLNLLPIPVLDGGHIFYFLLELLFRRPVNVRVRNISQKVGMAALLSLMVIAFYNDVLKYVLHLR